MRWTLNPARGEAPVRTLLATNGTSPHLVSGDVQEQQPSGLVDSAAAHAIRASGKRKWEWMPGRQPVVSPTCEPA